MLDLRFKFFLALSIICLSGIAHGQLDDDDFEEVNPTMTAPESAPREAPYVNESSEFEEFDSAERKEAEVLSVPSSNTPTPTPGGFDRGVSPNANSSASSETTYSGTPAVNRVRPPGTGAGARVEKIAHPLAAKGLIRIEADGTYVYKTKVSPHNKTVTARFGLLQPPEISGPDGSTTFKSMYTSSDIPVVFLDYEWQPFSQYGKLGIQGGFGFFTSQGNGRFLSDGAPAREKFTFLAFPINLGVVYRLEWMKRQWLAPYVAGGGTYFAVAETRDDDKSPKFVGSAGAYGAGGMMFNITALDRDTAFTMDSEYGISNLWLSAEYRYIKSFSEDLDFSSGVVNIGFAADY